MFNNHFPDKTVLPGNETKQTPPEVATKRQTPNLQTELLPFLNIYLNMPAQTTQIQILHPPDEASGRVADAMMWPQPKNGPHPMLC